MEIKLTNAGVALQQQRDVTGTRRNVLKEQQDLVEKSRKWAMSGQGKAIANGYRSMQNDGTGGKSPKERLAKFDRKI